MFQTLNRDISNGPNTYSIQPWGRIFSAFPFNYFLDFSYSNYIALINDFPFFFCFRSPPDRSRRRWTKSRPLPPAPRPEEDPVPATQEKDPGQLEEDPASPRYVCPKYVSVSSEENSLSSVRESTAGSRLSAMLNDDDRSLLRTTQYRRPHGSSSIVPMSFCHAFTLALLISLRNSLLSALYVSLNAKV